MKRLVVYSSLIAALAVPLAGISAAEQASGQSGPAPLVWVGCGITKKAFMQELAGAYERKTGQQIKIEGGGATKGIRQVAALQSDMGGTCRHVVRGASEEQGVKLFPVAWDALAVIVHKSNPVQSVTLEQVRDIYLGKIRNWKEVGGPDAPLELFARKGKISGVGLTLRQLVFADENTEFAASQFFPSTGPLEQAVEKSPNSIGITGISSARKRDVKIIQLEGKDPSYANIRSGEYLLYRPLYIVGNLRSPHYGEVKGFVDFAHSSEGRDIVRANGVVPYLEATHLIRKQLQQWREAKELRLEASSEEEAEETVISQNSADETTPAVEPALATTVGE